MVTAEAADGTDVPIEELAGADATNVPDDLDNTTSTSMAPGSLKTEDGVMTTGVSMEGMTETQQLYTLRNQVKI